MTRSNRLTRLVKYLLLSYLLLTPVLLSLQSILIQPAYGDPGAPYTFESHPSTHDTDLDVTDAVNAYDLDSITSAQFSRDVDGYFELSGFAKRRGKINGVDFTLDCEATSSSDDAYRILYLVDPSPEKKVLLNWTSALLTRMAHTWEFAEEPNNGIWNETDVENVRFQVETDTHGAPDDADFRIYEAWLTLYIDYPILSVDPLELVDPSLTPGEEFTIDIIVDRVERPSAYQFEMTFNPDVLEGVSVADGPFLGSQGGDIVLFPGAGFDNEKGTLSLFGATLDPVDEKNPIGGSEQFGPLAIVTFRVVGYGVSNLTLGETTALVDTEGGFIVDGETMPVCLKHGYFSNEQHTLTINSTPISGVEFTLDEASHVTPFAVGLSEGSYTIVMPSEWTVGEIPYAFLHWEDDSTDPTRIIQLTADTSVTATYIEAGKYKLAIESAPMTGVDFTLNGELYQTPFVNETMSTGSYTIVMPTEWTVDDVPYTFLQWDDGPTSATRVIQLTSNMSLTANYTKPAEYQLTIGSLPISGVEFTLDGESHVTPFSEILLAGSYVVKMPSEWTVGETVYEFHAWTDLYMQRQRTVTLTSNKTLTAMYTFGVERHTLEINATTAVYSLPLEDVDFTLDGSLKTTPFSNQLEARRHVILMPPELDVEGTQYWFVKWADDFTNPARVVDLTANMSLTAVYANLTVHNINQDTYYEIIQDAIDDADPNDAIEVYPNIYYEHLFIDKPLELLGKDPYTTIIDGIDDLYNDVIWVDLTENVIISGFTLRNSGWDGVYMWDSSDITISNNIILDCSTGIWVDYSDLNTISNNVIFGSDWEGIYMTDSSHNTIAGNTFSNCYDGIWVEDECYYNTIFDNTISNSGEYGISIWYPSCNNTIYHNNFLENAEQAYDDGGYGDNFWDNGYPSGGNYWSDYTGEDDKTGPNQDIPHPFPDGIGDTPYQIDADSNDTYPLSSPSPMWFDVIWDDVAYPVQIISNSTITAFKFSRPDKQISFNVTGPDGTTGFCKVKFRKDLLDAQPGEWIVLVNGTQVSDPEVVPGFWNQLHLAFNHSTQMILIEGETVVDTIPPIANASLTAPLIVDEDTEEVAFNGSASWDDIAIKNYTWTFEENGIPTVLVGEAVDYTFETPGFYFVTLEVTDFGNNWDTDAVMITVKDTTDPIADASRTNTTVNEDTPLTLDGSASTDNVDIVDHTWYVEDVPPTTLPGETQTYNGWAKPGVYNVTLKVSDAAGNSDTDTIWITVLDVEGPTADAGPDQTVDEDTEVTLDGSASSDNVGIVGYTWTFTDETLQTLEGNVTTYTFVTPGSYLVTLNVSDAVGNWDTDEVDITVVDITGPTADAGADQTVDEDVLVTFNGSASLDNGPIDIINYTWTFTDNQTTQTLVGMVTNYTFYMPGIYSVTLNVTDAEDNWDIDKIEITVLDVTDPVADAGVDQTVDEGTSVAFDGSASTDNVGVESCTWTFLDGGVLQILDGENVTYEFANPGIYSVTLRVADAEGNWDTDVIVITVLDIFYPVADAGLDQVVDEDTLVIFDGSGSADNVGIETYKWAFMENGKLRTLMSVNPNYIFVTPGVYLVTLNVTDAAGHSAADEVQITVRDVTAPVANAGPNSAVDEGTLLTLDGSVSSDNVGIVEYTWTFTDETPQTLEGKVTTYTFNTSGVYVVTLNVTDAVGYWATDTVTISVLSGQTSTGSGSLSIWDIVFVALAGAALGFAIFSFVRRGPKS